MTPARMLGALIALAAAPALPARAQFQPMVMRLPALDPNMEVGFGAMGGAGPGQDLLMTSLGSNATAPPSARFHRYRDLLGAPTVPYPIPTIGTDTLSGFAAVARFDGAPAPDVAWASTTSTTQDLEVAWGANLGTPTPVLQRFTLSPLPWPAPGPRSLRALQILPPPAPPLLAWTAGAATDQDVVGLLDLRGARTSGTIASSQRIATTPQFHSAEDDTPIEDAIFPVRLSPAAVATGVEDAVVPLRQGFRVLWNTGSTTFSATSVKTVTVGWTYPWLSLPKPSADSLELVKDYESCFGVGGLDVDGDGLRDLVFTMRAQPTTTPGGGKLVWARNTGDPTTLAAQTWHDLGARSDLQPLVDPGVLRELDLPGGPVIALHDRGRDEILIVTGDGVTGFRVARLPAFGARVIELWAADVVGGAAPDLLAWVELAGVKELWVYPDNLDLAPTLAWTSKPPFALVGFDLPLAVAAADPDTPFTVTWTRPGLPSTTGTSLVVTGLELCTPGPTVDVTVRAVDSLGVFRQLDASIPVKKEPTLGLVGIAAGAPIVLLPGGTPGRATGAAWPACGGTPVFTWATPGVTGVVLTPTTTGSTTAADFTIPEASYPGLLAGGASLTLRAVDSTKAPAWDATATRALTPDARGLVAVSVAFDEAALGPGELGLARVTLASRLGVPLPRVRAVVRLAGLSFAGPFQVSGAPAISSSEEGEVLVDPLPARDATVEIRVPVRSTGMPGAVSAELFSGQFRLSPEASPAAPGDLAPGCSCGADGGAGGLPIVFALALLAYMKPMRRVLARTR